jgi:uncharacterized protein YbgA (DUF1722 family)
MRPSAGEHGTAQRNGTGMFPQALMNCFPLLPVEEEGRLNDMPLREKCIERVFGLRRKAWLSAWQFAVDKLHDRMDPHARRGANAGWPGPWPVGPGQASSTPPTSWPAKQSGACFAPWPTAHPDLWSGHYTEMGRLVADAGKRDWDELTAEYGAMLMEGLSVMGTRGKHVNVLQHLMGYLRNHLSSEDKQELLGLIEDYRQGLVPLIVPLTLLKHHLNRYPVPDWVHQQVYLHPYPKELMLRNHV